jgi:hypothetical protein
MSWMKSLTPADIAELRSLGERAEGEDFRDFLFLAVTILTLGPIPVAEMAGAGEELWKDTYGDQFEVRRDGCVRLRSSLRVVA